MPHNRRLPRTGAVSFLLALCMLTGCGTDTVSEATPKETAAPVITAEPETTEPQWIPGTVLADNVGAVRMTMQRGTEVTVCGETGDYYLIEADGMQLFVEKCMIRTADETVFTEQTAYVQTATDVYSTAYLNGKPLKTLAQNTEITVLDSLDGVLCIHVGNTEGYIDAALAGLSKTDTWRENEGGTSSGKADGEDGNGMTLFGTYGSGGICFLAETGDTILPLETAGTVFSDGTELYAAIFNRGDGISVISADGETCTVWVNETVCTVPVALVSDAEAPEYAEWTGYTAEHAVLYSSWRLTRATATLPENIPLTVKENYGTFLLVSCNGEEGYMLIDSVREAPETEAHTGGTEQTEDDGGNSADGIWTDPIL